MKDGICNSCKSKHVYAKENGFTHGKGFQVVTGFQTVYELSKTKTILLKNPPKLNDRKKNPKHFF